jgi:hypothetical protein
MQDVIFAGTRERKPTGMAEVSLTLVDPEVYGDVAEPEIEIQDDMPQTEDDWDESALRTARAEDAERYSEEVRPGPGDEEVPRRKYPATPSFRCVFAPPFRLQPDKGATHPQLPAMSSSKSAAASSSAPSRPAKSRSRAACSAPAKANIC